MYTSLKNYHTIGKVTMTTSPIATSTFAGANAASYVEGALLTARFNAPYGIAIHPTTGDIYIADYSNQTIRKITISTNKVSTYAGIAGTTGTINGAIASSTFNNPCGLAFDTDGSLYVLQSGSPAIRKIDPTGTTVSTISTSVTGTPYHFAYANGYFYVVETTGNKIDKVSLADGTKITLAGSGTAGTSDGTGASATFTGPRGIAVDASGNVYVAEYNTNIIRMITPAGVVTTIAGNGTASSTDAIGTSATLNLPAGVIFDGSGNLYVGEAGSSKIRKIVVNPYSINPTLPAGLSFDPTTGIISGTPTVAVAATDYTITANNTKGSSTAVVNITIGAAPIISYTGNPLVYIVNKAINSLTPSNTGNPVQAGGYSISPALPSGLSIDASTGVISGTPTVASSVATYTITATNTYGSGTATVNISVIIPPSISYSGSPLTYTVNSAISSLTPTNTGGVVPATTYGTVSTTVASPGGQVHGMAFNSDYSLMYTGLKNVYRVGKVTMSLGTSATLAGTGSVGSVDGTGTAASFGTTGSGPYGVAVHPTTGDIYVADQGNHTIRKITIGGVVTTYAGITGTASSVDGAIASATFVSPACLAFDTDGSLYVLQWGSSKIRKINAAGTTVSTIASNIGTSTYHFAFANGYFYVTDAGSTNNVYKVNLADGTKTVLAGSGASGSVDGTGTGASFAGPRGIVVDATGNVYVNDYSTNKIRMITPEGVVTTIAGSGTNTSTDGVGTAATFNLPAGLVLDNVGNLYVGEAGGQKIRKVVVKGYTISPALPAGLSFDGTTGIISGTPTSGSASTDYTITAFNGGGSSSAIINITIGSGTSLFNNQLATPLTAYADGNTEIRINGAVSKNAVATLYNVRGCIVCVKNLTEGNLNSIQTSYMNNGVYLLSIKNNDNLQRIKVLVK
jgi:DNA-binding beta-propeller fold protein YncE